MYADTDALFGHEKDCSNFKTKLKVSKMLLQTNKDFYAMDAFTLEPMSDFGSAHKDGKCFYVILVAIVGCPFKDRLVEVLEEKNPAYTFELTYEFGSTYKLTIGIR